jgi:small subunit ribosomal protein S17e
LEWYKIPSRTLLIVDRIIRLSRQVLQRHRDKFTTDFADNKKLLEQLTIIRSKGLKNEMAGYITKFVKRENDSKALKEEVEEEVEEVEEVKAETPEQETAEESIPQEIVVESASEESG